MQERAAAIYAVFFLVVAAGAYGMVGFAQEPTVTVDDPEYTLSAGDTLTVDDRTYTVGEVESGSTDLSWVNDSVRHTASIENNSTVASTDVVWEGQQARQSATFGNDTTVTIDGTEYQVVVSGGESPSSVTFASGDSEETFEVGGTFAYQGEEVTVTEITSEGVTVAWGEPYRVLVADESDPSSFAFEQEFNVSKRLADDPVVEDDTVTRADGERYVVYQENDTTRPLSEYLPQPERREFSEGDSLGYQTNQAQVVEVTNESVTVEWTAPETESVSLEDGSTTALGDVEYVVHARGDGTIALSTDVEGYDRQVAAVTTYNERMSGLWGISILGGLAAIVLVGTAYLPSRY